MKYSLKNQTHTPWIVCVTEKTLRFDFLLSFFMVCSHCNVFQVHRQTEDLSTKMQFFCVSVSFLLAVWFCIYIAHAVENPEISRFRVSDIRAVPTDHKQVKKIKKQGCSVTQTNLMGFFRKNGKAIATQYHNKTL